METVKVDLLVIGDIMTSSYMACNKVGGISAAGNSTEITPSNIPDSVEVGEFHYDLRNAIVLDATDKPVEATSLFAPDGKSVFASGNAMFLAKDSCRQGTSDALNNQWIPVDEQLPGESEEVLCRMKSNGAVVSGFIFINKKGIPQVATDSCFHFEDYEGYEPTHWMPLPPLNPEKEER